MSSNVFLAPCDPANFDLTVRETVDATLHDDAPPEVADEESLRFWGVRDGAGNERFFEKMEPGDLVLFYHDGTYVGTAWIDETFEDEDRWASSTFWDDAPAARIYTLTEFSPVSVPRAAVNAIFDYGADYYPQGLMRVADSRVGKQPAAIKLAVERYDERN